MTAQLRWDINGLTQQHSVQWGLLWQLASGSSSAEYTTGMCWWNIANQTLAAQVRETLYTCVAESKRGKP